MRNLAQRISNNNCFLVYGSNDYDELATVRHLLKVCMECSASCLTTSEEAVLDDFSDWYMGINWQRPYSVKEPAWFYCNLNEGYNLLVQVAVPCEGSVADGLIVGSTWRPSRVKMI